MPLLHQINGAFQIASPFSTTHSSLPCFLSVLFFFFSFALLGFMVVPFTQKDKFDKLVFTQLPPRKTQAGQILPLIQIQANPEADQLVELVVHGRAHVTGTTQKRLIVNKGHPSIAYFDDIRISPAGHYVIEIRSVNNHAIYAKSPHQTTVEPPPRPRTALEVLFADYSHMLDH
eukprot:m.127851 g.127851  ORF g.127851 m.127851 type:complete len:174 (-) comp13856_c0_seq9:2410-2931(-)